MTTQPLHFVRLTIGEAIKSQIVNLHLNSGNFRWASMALLPSQLPFLYCMLCYRSDRSNNPRTQAARLLDLLDNKSSRDASSASGQDYPPFRLDRDNPGTQSQGHPGVQGQERLGQYSRDRSRPWNWHGRRNNDTTFDLDLDKLCGRNEPFRQKREKTKELSQSDTPGRAACFTTEPDDVRQMFPDQFLTVEELMKSLPRQTPAEAKAHPHQRQKPLRRYTVNSGYHQDLKFVSHSHCGSCYTEIGYEIVSEVKDFQGRNHTVLNFKNAYQFIAAGRCLNENSPCGGGGHARCTQVFRAHWTLVWTPETGTKLVAHEVPSHCECTNLGGPLSTEDPTNLKRSPPTFDPGN